MVPSTLVVAQPVCDQHGTLYAFNARGLQWALLVWPELFDFRRRRLFVWLAAFAVGSALV